MLEKATWAVCALIVVLAIAAAAPAVASERWREEIAAFERADAARRPAPGGVVFVGSSSIRLWEGLEAAFPRFPVLLKRGFGGSTLTDCIEHAERLVLAHEPRLVVVYAGENDIAEGATAEEVATRVQRFTERIRRAQPGVRIAYVSIKPSPLRQAALPTIRAANERIRTFLSTLSNAHFIDVHTPMLDAHGRPRAELFSADRLHLNAAGYTLWRREIDARLP
jgi:lysophospholipase L1-like esterase